MEDNKMKQTYLKKGGGKLASDFHGMKNVRMQLIGQNL